MDQLRIGDQLIEYDKQRTLNAYASITQSGAEECGCTYCRNFIAQRSSVFPVAFLELLKTIGIDPNKEGEVYECGGSEGVHQYGGWFYFVGRVVEAGERLTKIGTEFEYYFLDASTLPRPSAEFGEHIAAIDFSMRAPWVLAEPPE